MRGISNLKLSQNSKILSSVSDLANDAYFTTTRPMVIFLLVLTLIPIKFSFNHNPPQHGQPPLVVYVWKHFVMPPPKASSTATSHLLLFSTQNLSLWPFCYSLLLPSSQLNKCYSSIPPCKTELILSINLLGSDSVCPMEFVS